MFCVSPFVAPHMPMTPPSLLCGRKRVLLPWNLPCVCTAHGRTLPVTGTNNAACDALRVHQGPAPVHVCGSWQRDVNG